MLGSQIKQIWVIITHLKTVARHNLKWVKKKLLYQFFLFEIIMYVLVSYMPVWLL